MILMAFIVAAVSVLLRVMRTAGTVIMLMVMVMMLGHNFLLLVWVFSCIITPLILINRQL